MSRIHQICFLMLLIFPKVFAADFEIINKNGKVYTATPLGDYNSNGVRSWRLTDPNGNYGGVHVSYDRNYDANSYKGTTQGNAVVKSAATGAKSVNTVPATVTRTVAKREVMSKVFRNGRAIGARVLTKGIPIVGQLALAWELADAVAKQKGYQWSDDQKNWVKPSDDTVRYMMRTSDPIAFNANNIWTHRHIENWCNKRSSSGGSRDCSLPQLTTATGEQFAKMVLSMCGSSKITIHGGGKPKTEVVTADRLDPHRYCARGIYTFSWGVVSGTLKEKYLPLTEDEFVRIAEPTADSNPSTWVKAAEPKSLSWSEPEVTVPNGMAAQSSTYTNDKGQAGQTRWTFSTPKGATSSTANEEFHLRPDLQPDSAEAPRIKTPPKSSTESTNLPSGETESGGNGKKPPPPSESDLCDKYPDILACQQMGEAEESIFDGLKIPETIDDRTWEEDQFLPSDGQCPKPKHFSVWGKRFEVSYEPLCELMRQIRFMVLTAFILMSAYIVFGSLRSNK